MEKPERAFFIAHNMKNNLQSLIILQLTKTFKS